MSAPFQNNCMVSAVWLNMVSYLGLLDMATLEAPCASGSRFRCCCRRRRQRGGYTELPIRAGSFVISSNPLIEMFRMFSGARLTLCAFIKSFAYIHVQPDQRLPSR